jgi:hypothetical protein
LDFEDVERRRLLVTSAIVGHRAANATLTPLVERTAPHWGRQIVKAIPMSAINKANAVLGPRFVTKYGVVQGSLVLGKQVPRFIGAAIGAGGNGLFGMLLVKTTRKLLGPPPEDWDELSALRGTDPMEQERNSGVRNRPDQGLGPLDDEGAAG